MSRNCLQLIPPLLAAIALWLLPGVTAAAGRVALVIGNDRYDAAPRLNNAANDARGIAEALRGDLGFTLVGGAAQIDRNRGQALDLLERFRRESAGADIALFYFAGHGVAESGENWLVPSDDRTIAFREDVPLHALSQQAVLDRMQARVNVMVLDACRNNPLPSRAGGRSASRGLQPKGGPRGTLVAYAAGAGEVALDGNVASNGLYTRELLKRIRMPGQRLDDLFRAVGDAVYAASGQRQNPAIQDQLRDGAVYLLPGGSGAAPGPALVQQPVPDAERLAYEAAQAVNSLAGWQSFLNSYPDGVYASAARVQMSAITPVASPAFEAAPARKPKCEGLTQAQCTFVGIVDSCELGGTGHKIENGRVTINGSVIGHVNAAGKVVDNGGRVITELTKSYENNCR